MRQNTEHEGFVPANYIKETGPKVIQKKVKRPCSLGARESDGHKDRLQKGDGEEESSTKEDKDESQALVWAIKEWFYSSTHIHATQSLIV